MFNKHRTETHITNPKPHICVTVGYFHSTRSTSIIFVSLSAKHNFLHCLGDTSCFHGDKEFWDAQCCVVLHTLTRIAEKDIVHPNLQPHHTTSNPTTHCNPPPHNPTTQPHHTTPNLQTHHTLQPHIPPFLPIIRRTNYLSHQLSCTLNTAHNQLSLKQIISVHDYLAHRLYLKCIIPCGLYYIPTMSYTDKLLVSYCLKIAVKWLENNPNVKLGDIS